MMNNSSKDISEPDGLYHYKLRKLLYIGLYFPHQPGVQFLHYTIYQVFNYCHCLVCNYILGHGVKYLLPLSGGVDYYCRSLSDVVIYYRSLSGLNWYLLSLSGGVTY